MDDNKRINCYFTCNFTRRTRTARLRIIVVSSKNIIYKSKRRFNKKDGGIARDVSINKVFKVLSQLETDNKINSADKVNIFMNDKNIVDQISENNGFEDVRKGRKNQVRQLNNVLKKHNNWELIYQVDAHIILKKLFQPIVTNNHNLVKKSKCKAIDIKKHKRQNIVRKISDIKIDSIPNIVFFDIEMNCDYDKNNKSGTWEAISIGAVRYNTNDNTIDKFYSLIKPRFNNILSDRCREITGICQAEIDIANDFREVMQAFGRWIGNNKCIFVSWGAEDIKVVKNDNKRNGFRIQVINYIKNNYLDFQKEFGTYHLNSRQAVSLINALKELQLEFEGIRHNALDDAINLYRAYIDYISRV